MGIEMNQLKSIVLVERITVSPMRSQIRSLTGFSHSIDWPQSPRVRMPLIHFQYWT